MAVALRELLASFGFEVDSSALKTADAAVKKMAVSMRGLVSSAKETGERTTKGLGMQDLVKAVQGFGAAWAANALVQRVAGFARELEHVGSELQDTSAQLGVSTVALQQWRYIAGQSGASAQAVSNGLAYLQRNAVAAANGGKAQAAVFQRLGVSIRDASGNIRPASDLMLDVGVGISRLGDDASRTAVAMQLFGRGGRALIPTFAQGEEGIRKMREEFEALGGGMSTEAVDAADEYGDAITRIDTAMLSLRSRIGVSLLPVLAWLADRMAFTVGWFSKATKGGHELEVGMGLLGLTAARAAWRFIAAWASALWPVAAAAAAIGVVVLVVGDLVAMFQGKKSVIGAFVDELWGIGTTKQVVTDLTDAWDGFVMTLEWIGEKISEIFGKVSSLGTSVREAFSGSLSSGVLGQLRDAATSTAGAFEHDRNLVRRGAIPSVSASIAGGGRLASQTTTNVINVSGAGDPDAVAGRVMRRLNEQRAAESRAALVAAGGEGD